MALFKPGEGGRKLGSKNKFKLTTMKECFREMELDLAPLIIREIMGIASKPERVSLLLKLYAWVEPRVQKIENMGTRPDDEASQLKDKQLDALLSALQNSVKLSNDIPVGK